MSLIPPDAARGVAALCVALATITDGAIGFAVMFLVLGGCMVPRALGLPAALDVLVCSTLLVAAWAALLDWYLKVPALDLVVHAVTTGLVALLVWACFSRVERLARACRQWTRLRIAVTVVGAAMVLAAVWEVAEWLGHTHLDRRIQVSVVDTATDLLAGLVGSIAAIGWVERARRSRELVAGAETAR